MLVTPIAMSIFEIPVRKIASLPKSKMVAASCSQMKATKVSRREKASNCSQRRAAMVQSPSAHLNPYCAHSQTDILKNFSISFFSTGLGISTCCPSSTLWRNGGNG